MFGLRAADKARQAKKARRRRLRFDYLRQKFGYERRAGRFPFLTKGEKRYRREVGPWAVAVYHAAK